MAKISSIVNVHDKSEAFAFLNALVRNSFERTSYVSSLFGLVSFYVKKAYVSRYIEDDFDTANHYMTTAAVIAFLFNVVFPLGDALDEEEKEDDEGIGDPSIIKLKNGETLTEADYEYLVSTFETRFIKAGFERDTEDALKYFDLMDELALKWIGKK